MNNNCLLATRQVTKVFQNSYQKTVVIKNCDLQICPGKITALMGPSGSGKSTLIHLLGGMLAPTSGQVIFQGQDIYQWSAETRARWRNQAVGFVFQGFHLLPELTVLENVSLPAWIQARYAPAEVKTQARALLAKLGLAPRAQAYPCTLSGGESQRVAIARALINKPAIIFCDEPTGNLDSQNASNILAVLVKLNQESNQTIVLVSHDPIIIASAQQIYSVQDGVVQGG
jgi:lipoprotein-releasing system ATP-binding protein